MLKNWKKTDKNILNHEKCQKNENTLKNVEKSSKMLQN